MAGAALHTYLEWPGPIAFAHRGGASDNPENTMPAFQHAVDLGYTYLETDVHATSDGVLVAFHDPDLSRTCDRTGTINELTWAEVSRARVRNEEPIPLFDDLLEAFPNARFNVDCKADSAVDGLIAAIKRHGCLDRICVGGFSDKRIRRFRDEFGSALCSSFGPLQIAALRFTGRVPWGGQVAQIPVSVRRLTVTHPKTIRRAHKLGLQVHVWTIDDAAEMHRLLDMGVDGIMTDRLQTLKDVLIDRDAWH
jgi:glycerophosphoryl diester phosphodiesterase